MKKLLVILGLLVGLMQSVVAEDRPDPLEMVRQTADNVLHQVTAHKATLDMDPSGVYVIVNRYILPHFDFNYMTRSAVGKYWRKADKDQQAALQEEFSQLLVRTYGVALLNYSGQEIIYEPLRDATVDKVMVETKVAQTDGGPQIPVNYRLKFDEGKWMVYDVVIDGISLVSNYRTSFASQIRRSGIDGLIKELSDRNKS